MIKKFFIGTLVVAALAFAVSASAAYDFGTTTLKVGSKGEVVKTLQTLVGATPVDGVFGKGTKAKVMAWQVSNGLKGDGLFGKASMLKANSGVVVGTTCPAGQFDTMTGKPCGTISTLPAGCTSTVGYSPLNAAKCDGTTTGTTVNGPLTGGAGSIDAVSTSTDVETTVTEGTSNVKVLGFKVEATDSDAAISNLKVTLQNNTIGTDSTRLDRYVGTVSVYMNGTKVGSADVSDFTKDGITYSKSIALTNAVVRQGSSNKATFYVTLSANSSIDSLNMGIQKWGVQVDNIRYQDATGVIMTDSQTVGDYKANKFSFTSLATSGDVKVTVSEGSSNPLTQTVSVSDTGSTKNVLMLEMKIKTTGSPISFDTLKVTPTSAGSTITSIVGELQLRDGSSTLATIDGSTLASTVASAFNLDSTYTIPADTTRTLDVYATINDWDNFKAAGGTLKVDFAHTGLSPEDSNGDIVTSSNYVGSVNGNIQSFLLDGAQVTYVSDSYTSETTGTNPSNGTIGMNFTVTAFGSSDVTVAETQVAGATSGAGVVVNAVTGATAIGNGIVTSSDLTKNGSNNFVVTAGNTGHFTLSRKFNSASGFVRLTVTSVNGTAVTNVMTGAH